MYQAIEVKFLAPTNHRGSRYKAIASAGSVIHHADYSLNPSDNGRVAAQKLADKFAWDGAILQGGTLANGNDVFTISYNEGVAK